MTETQEKTGFETFKTQQERLARMTTDEIIQLILDDGEKISELEFTMNLACSVLDARGTSVDSELNKKSKKNEQT